jgi:hypothetical protein
VPAHLGGVDLLEVLGDVQDALRDLVLVQVATPREPSPEGRERRCCRVGAGLLQWDAHVLKHGLSELLHRGLLLPQITHAV